MIPKWEAVEDGHHAVTTENDMEVSILLQVGHGLPMHSDGMIGRAEITIRKPSQPTICERLCFRSHPYRGEVTGEFFSSDGITEDAGGFWDVDHVELADPSTLDDGDETNDDAMKKFIESYVSKIDFEDELMAAQEENFAMEIES